MLGIQLSRDGGIGGRTRLRIGKKAFISSCRTLQLNVISGSSTAAPNYETNRTKLPLPTKSTTVVWGEPVHRDNLRKNNRTIFTCLHSRASAPTAVNIGS